MGSWFVFSSLKQNWPVNLLWTLLTLFAYIHYFDQIMALHMITFLTCMIVVAWWLGSNENLHSLVKSTTIAWLFIAFFIFPYQFVIGLCLGILQIFLAIKVNIGIDLFRMPGYA